MEAIVVLISTYIVLYAVYIRRLISGFPKVENFSSGDIPPKTGFSVIVPFRNEALNLPALLESFTILDYPAALIDFIFIDDFSTDDSYSIINRWRLANDKFHTTLIESIRLSNSPKKDAIMRAIPIVQHEWVITTDADCVVPGKWLKTFDSFIRSKNPGMIAGPVVYDAKFRFSHFFQQADLLALQGATIGSFGMGKAFMCNAANFAFTKTMFLNVGGFSGNSQLASGDDVFLLQKAVDRFPESVMYLKSRDAIIRTKPVSGWLSVFFQRIRWASKANSYISDFAEMLALVVFFGNVALASAILLSVFGFIDWRIAAVLFAVKFISDYILAFRANSFLRNGKFFFPIVSGIIYPFFSTLVGLYSLYGKYKWKGRILK